MKQWLHLSELSYFNQHTSSVQDPGCKSEINRQVLRLSILLGETELSVQLIHKKNRFIRAAGTTLEGVQEEWASQCDAKGSSQLPLRYILPKC